MKTHFRLNGSQVVEVGGVGEPGSNNSVEFAVIEGAEYERSREPFTVLGPEDQRKVVACLILRRNEARAIASALMACAAEK